MKPLISIITPVYNASKYLQRCVESILVQEYTNFELLLINDGSTDDSGDICDRFAQNEKRIKVIHKQNGGVSKARNQGLSLAKGDYVTFVDSDDWVEASWLKDVSTVIAKNPDIEIIKWGYYIEYDKETVCTTSHTDILVNSPKEMLTYVDKFGYDGYIWNSMFKRCAIKDVRFDESLKYCEDHLFSFYAFNNSKCMYLMSAAYYHYINHSSNSLSDIKDPYQVIDSGNKEIEIRQIIGVDIKMMNRIQYRNINHSLRVCYSNFKYKERKTFCQHLANSIKDNGLKKPHRVSMLQCRIIPFFIKDLLLATKYRYLSKIKRFFKRNK